MSERQYESMLARWNEFLQDFYPLADEDNKIGEDSSNDQYDDAVDEFCKKYRYSDKTKEMAFYGKWWDTFKDEYFKKLEKLGVEIVHDETVTKEKPAPPKEEPRP